MQQVECICLLSYFLRFVAIILPAIAWKFSRDYETPVVLEYW